MLASNTISIYVLNYMATYAATTLHMSPSAAFGATAAIGLCGVCVSLAGGALSVRIGRKPVMLAGTLALLVITLPIFWVMSVWRTPLVLIGGSSLMAVFVALTGPQILAVVLEALPPGLRAGGLGLVYAPGDRHFWRLGAVHLAWLMHVTGSPLAPAWYMTAAMIVGLVAMLLARETAPVSGWARRPAPEPVLLTSAGIGREIVQAAGEGIDRDARIPIFPTGPPKLARCQRPISAVTMSPAAVKKGTPSIW